MMKKQFLKKLFMCLLILFNSMNFYFQLPGYVYHRGILIILSINYRILFTMNESQQRFSVCMQRLRNQINNFHSLNENKGPELLNDLRLHLQISNQHVRYQLQHGQDFKDMLDPRDRVLEHSFNFKHIFSPSQMESEGGKFEDSALFIAILSKIKIFLAQSISNVVSIAFKFMCKGQLQSKQAKDYAAKNIMLNVHSIYRQTINAIESNSYLKDNFNLQDLRSNLIIEVDNVINNILINLADSYPQAPAAGGTPRMREVITQVNRVDDQTKDFIFTSGIKLKDYIHMSKDPNYKGKNSIKINLEENDDYTEFIMRVVNAAVEMANSTKQDSRQRTTFETFTQFNEKLFWLSQQQSYQKLLANISKKKSRKDTAKDRKLQEKETDGVCSLFRRILTTQYTGYQEYQEQLVRWMDAGRVIDVDESTRVLKELARNWQSSDQAVQSMKNKKQFVLGHKIPASVKPFNRQQISNRQFTAKHSSILRILTKWAGYLQDLFSNSHQLVKQRLYPFVNLDNQLVHLKIGDKNGDQKLSRQLDEEYQIVKGKFNIILKNSYGFIGKLMSTEQQSIVSSVSRYTETRTVSSKVNAVLTSLMLNYINILIHHLLQAGQNISSERGNQNLNLVVFKISDLMRSKYNCSQAAFLNVLKTIYLLDSNQEMQTKFKIVRIKNKLDQPANNVMINYLFMGKVQCQLQLSIQETKGKQKNYFTFSHFVYQLTRGKFGSIAECAIMISQLDPMIGACKQPYYRQKQAAIVLSRKSKPVEQNSFLKNCLLSFVDIDQSKVIKTVFFQCSECGQLITNQDIAQILEKPELKICYKCILKKPQTEQYLKPQIRDNLKLIKKRRIKGYFPLNLKNQRQKYTITLNSVGQLSFSVVLASSRQSKMFMIEIDKKLLESVKKIDFNNLAYVDISTSIREGLDKQLSLPTLTYLFDKIALIPKEVFEMTNIDPEGLSQKINEIIRVFRIFRIEKNIIKGIKYKAEIIKANQNQGKILDRVCEALVLGDNIRYSSNIFDNVLGMAVNDITVDDKHLHYTKEKSLDLSYIDKIESERAGYEIIPRWVRTCHNLLVLDLDYNNIHMILKEELPTSLHELSLKYNQLEAIDLTGMVALVDLNLKCNRLKSIDLSSCNSLLELIIRDNQLQAIEKLPYSLKALTVDRKAILNFSFVNMMVLQVLRIRKGKTSREELVALASEVKIFSKET